jgi:hypothetical protein
MLQSLVSTHSIWVGEESTYSMQGEPSAGTALWLGYTTSRSVVSILSDKIAKLMYIREGLGREFKIRFRAYTASTTVSNFRFSGVQLLQRTNTCALLRAVIPKVFGGNTVRLWTGCSISI